MRTNRLHKLNEKPIYSANAFVVGVTGHRFLFFEDSLVEAIVCFFDTILAHKSFKKPLIVISPLAEGADRLVARVALERYQAKLWVPLPMPMQEYMEDFCCEDSKTEFMQLIEQSFKITVLPKAHGRNESYHQAGMFMLQQCHALIALWDGKKSRGHGGTADIVQSALSMNKPIGHIFTENHISEKRKSNTKTHHSLQWHNLEQL